MIKHTKLQRLNLKREVIDVTGQKATLRSGVPSIAGGAMKEWSLSSRRVAPTIFGHEILSSKSRYKRVDNLRRRIQRREEKPNNLPQAHERMQNAHATHLYLILPARSRGSRDTCVIPHHIHDGPSGTRTLAPVPRHSQRNRKSRNPHPKIFRHVRKILTPH